MMSINFFLIFVPILSIILIAVNFILAPHLPYKEKKTPFECGYHSFLLQNRTQFTISFFIFALLFLLFDLEIVLLYPFTVSSHANMIYGLIMMVLFAIIVTIGFVYELGKNALKIDSRQYSLWSYITQPQTKHTYSKEAGLNLLSLVIVILSSNINMNDVNPLYDEAGKQALTIPAVIANFATTCLLQLNAVNLPSSFNLTYILRSWRFI